MYRIEFVGSQLTQTCDSDLELIDFCANNCEGKLLFIHINDSPRFFYWDKNEFQEPANSWLKEREEAQWLQMLLKERLGISESLER